MRGLFLLLLSFSLNTYSARAQKTPAGADIPSPKEFVNAVFTNVVDSKGKLVAVRTEPFAPACAKAMTGPS